MYVQSNFPVDKLSLSYSIYWNAMKRIASEFSDDEQHDFSMVLRLVFIRSSLFVNLK